MKRVLIAVAALAAAFGASTWWALESEGVAVIETRTPEGGHRSTHVWYVEPNGELWLEAGTPENAWFQDVQRNSIVTFTSDGRSTRHVARPLDDPSGHSRIRSWIHEKYGFRDRWVGLIIDPSRSIAVQLHPAEE